MFDEKYYNDIWGTVHRHDYCENLADSLIAKYGKVRYLDIGTGCGYLVKLLNDKGAIAKGLEISKYAVTNSHGNTLLGSITDIPFKDREFDVIHSQGLWEYIKEEEITKAWQECNRIGLYQVHNIDTVGSDIGEEGFIISKTRDWWDEKLKLRLNLGCGGVHKDNFINIDINCREAIKFDLTQPLWFADESVDEIYASHIIEHFSRAEWKRVKKDWTRVLEQDGKLTIGCPDFEKCLINWQNDKTTDYWLQTIYGSQENEFNFHKNGFTKDSLIQELEGFMDFNVIKDEAQDMEVECRKS